MEAVRTRRGRFGSVEAKVVLRAALLKQIDRTIISVRGVPHRLKLAGVRPGGDEKRRTVLITVTTDRTRSCAHVEVLRDRLDRPDFVASLLAHAIRALLTGELPADGVEDF